MFSFYLEKICCTPSLSLGLCFVHCRALAQDESLFRFLVFAERELGVMFQKRHSNARKYNPRGIQSEEKEEMPQTFRVSGNPEGLDQMLPYLF
jgi:hypothetical protein